MLISQKICGFLTSIFLPAEASLESAQRCAKLSVSRENCDITGDRDLVCGCTLSSTLKMHLTPLLMVRLIRMLSLLQSMQPDRVLHRTDGLTTGGHMFISIWLSSDGVYPKGLPWYLIHLNVLGIKARCTYPKLGPSSSPCRFVKL